MNTNTPDLVRQTKLKARIIRVAKAYGAPREEVPIMLKAAKGDFDEAERCFAHLCRELDEGMTV